MKTLSDAEFGLDVPQTNPLLEKDFSEEEEESKPQQRKERYSLTLLIALLLSCLVNVALLSNSVCRTQRDIFPEYFFSPVLDLLTYHPRLFTTGLGDETTAYQGPPSVSKQAAWNALYRQFLRIPPDAAVKLNNKTVPVPVPESEHSQGEFGIGLMVFHNLHCLHTISEVLDVLHYPSHYGFNASFNPFDGIHTNSDFITQQSLPHAFLDVLHVEHCVDMLRQALMCNADITPYVFQEMDVGTGMVGTMVGTVHMCADFQALRDWAAEREFDGVFTATNASSMVGKCGPRAVGCGEEFGESGWRAQNKWMNSDPWIVHG